MAVKKYDRKDRANQYGVKWGHWKNPSYKFFEFESDRDAFFDELVKKEKREGLAALEISTMEAQIMRHCIDLLGSPKRVLTVCEAEAGNLATLDISLAQAVKEYLDEKLNLGRDDNYLRAIKNILEQFQTACPVIENCPKDSSLSQLQLDQVKAWVFSLGYRPISLVHDL